jgi:hypothetical protein
MKKIKEGGWKEKNNTRDSNVVPHRSTNRARWFLTSQSGRDAVLSSWYGRSCIYQTIYTNIYATNEPTYLSLNIHLHRQSSTFTKTQVLTLLYSYFPNASLFSSRTRPNSIQYYTLRLFYLLQVLQVLYFHCTILHSNQHGTWTQVTNFNYRLR